MIKLSAEIPTCKLKEWSPLVDVDFLLAHKVLTDQDYADHFKYDIAADRHIILDNCAHEFNKPIPMAALRCAKELCSANIVIAPDRVTQDGDIAQWEQNQKWLEQSGDWFSQSELGFVLNGPSVSCLVENLRHGARYASMLFFTFHQPERLEWWKLLHLNILKKFKRIHLLGLISISELRKWVEISEQHPEVEWSFDTSKAASLGSRLRCFEDFKEDDNLRHNGVKSKDVLDMTSFTEEQDAVIRSNFSFLRKVCRGEV